MSGAIRTRSSQLPATVPLITSANTFTGQPQVLKTNLTALQNQDASGNPLVSISPVGVGNGTFAGGMWFHSANSPDTFHSDHRTWYIGVDVSAATPYRDLVIGKFATNGNSNDFDGITFANGGAGPATMGIGSTQPGTSWSAGLFRCVIYGGGATVQGGSTSTQGGLLIPYNALTNPTTDQLSIGSNNNGQQAHRYKFDGTYIGIAAPPVSVTGTTGTTNATTTFTDPNANFTTDMVGRYFASSADFSDGTYIQTVVSATQLTLSQAAKTSTAGTVSYTIYGAAWRHRSTSGQPLISVLNNVFIGTTINTNTGVGPGVSNPSATLDVAQSGATNATLKVRTASWGQLLITANGAIPGDVSVKTPNGTALLLGSNNVTLMKFDSTGTKIGFFGATPVAQPALGAATAAATYGTNEQTMLQNAYNALRTLGLCS